MIQWRSLTYLSRHLPRCQVRLELFAFAGVHLLQRKGGRLYVVSLTRLLLEHLLFLEGYVMQHIGSKNTRPQEQRPLVETLQVQVSAIA